MDMIYQVPHDIHGEPIIDDEHAEQHFHLLQVVLMLLSVIERNHFMLVTGDGVIAPTKEQRLVHVT